MSGRLYPKAFNCTVCGRFVKLQDLMDGKAQAEDVGDLDDAGTVYYCSPCVEKDPKYWKEN